MKIRVECASIVDLKCDLLVVNSFEGEKKPEGAALAADKVLGGLIARLIREGEIDGKLGKVTLIHSNGELKTHKIAVVGLGKRDKLDMEAVRTAASAAIKKAREVKAKQVGTIVHGAGSHDHAPEEAAKALVEGSVLGVYKFPG